MKTNQKTAAALAAFALALATASAFASDSVPADLRAQAKVTEQEATATALAKVPHGKIKSMELEQEGGKLVWSFDIAQPASKNVTEIWVDATTGKIVSLKQETPAQEATEKKAEAKETKAAR